MHFELSSKDGSKHDTVDTIASTNNNKTKIFSVAEVEAIYNHQQKKIKRELNLKNIEQQ